MNSVLVSDSGIDLNSGGGLVSHHLLRALAESGRVEMAIARHLNAAGLSTVPFKPVLPKGFQKLPNIHHAFLLDYFAFRNLADLPGPVRLAQVYGNPFGLTAQRLKEMGAALVVDVAPHVSADSRLEWERLLGQPWPFDPDSFWERYSEHHRLADVVVVHSRASAAYLKEKSGLAQMPRVIPHGCELPGEVAPFPAQFMVGHLSQFGPDKGQSYLLVAWKGVGGGSLALAGSGTENLKPLAAHLGLAEVEFKGRVARAEDFYRQCTVYVQPSVTEGFGIPVLEAMAQGRPVVVAAGAGVSELVTDGENGFVVPVRDAAAIAHRLNLLREDPGLCASLGRAARETAAQYTWDKIRRQYREIYRELAG